MFEDRQATEKEDNTIQCLAWYNCMKFQDEDPCRNLVVIGTQAGKLKLVDIEKNRVVWKEDLGERNVIYDTDWGKNGVLVTGSLQKELVMRRFDRTTLKFEKLKSAAMPDSIRCV